jgi:hypothetical protein
MGSNLTDELRTVRSAIRELERGGSELFDEFLQEHEFDSALHVLCDSLLTPESGSVSDWLIQQIQILHSQMNLQDDCVVKLKQKREKG